MDQKLTFSSQRCAEGPKGGVDAWVLHKIGGESSPARFRLLHLNSESVLQPTDDIFQVRSDMQRRRSRREQSYLPCHSGTESGYVTFLVFGFSDVDIPR